MLSSLVPEVKHSKQQMLRYGIICDEKINQRKFKFSIIAMLKRNNFLQLITKAVALKDLIIIKSCS